MLVETEPSLLPQCRKGCAVNSTICRHQRIHYRDLSQKLKFLGMELTLMGAHAFPDTGESRCRTQTIGITAPVVLVPLGLL